MVTQPWMKFYIGDWLRDTRDLSPEARGALIEIRCHMWTKKENAAKAGALTSDLAGLSVILAIRYDRIRSILYELFDKNVLKCEKTEGDKIIITDEYMSQIIETHKVKANAGREGGLKTQAANATNKKNKKNPAKADAYNSAKAYMTSDIDIGKERDVGGMGDEEREPENTPPTPYNTNVILAFSSPEFRDAWQKWKNYLYTQHARSLAFITEQAHSESLWRMAGGDEETAIDIIKFSIDKVCKNLTKNDNQAYTRTKTTPDPRKSGAGLDDLDSLKRR